jgi:hypothetical protein
MSEPTERMRVEAVQFAKDYPELTLGQMLILAKFGSFIANQCRHLCDDESAIAIREAFL